MSLESTRGIQKYKISFCIPPVAVGCCTGFFLTSVKFPGHCIGRILHVLFFFFFQAEDGIRDLTVTGVQTCALPISSRAGPPPRRPPCRRRAISPACLNGRRDASCVLCGACACVSCVGVRCGGFTLCAAREGSAQGVPRQSA